MKRSTLGWLRVAFIGAAILAPSLAFAQPPGDGGPGGPGGFGGPFGGGGGLLGLVMRDEVQQEIQLVDEQREQVMNVADEAREKMRDEMRDLFSQMRDLNDEERRERFGEIRAKMEEMNADLDAQLKKALLPHQYERLKQIDFQARMQRGEAGLASGAVAEALNLSDEQREKLERRAEEVRQELQQKIRQAQAEARQKMLDVLTPEQKAKLEELMGDAFELRDEGRFGFGGRGGFRGRDERGGREGERGSDRPRE
ncbi:MAG: hypothetical protein L0228_03990 [Planctomycetes bacterium]|nr:hypothetical protein [Planctomycetota bacterium]